MKDGMTPQEFLTTLQDMQARKHDIVVDSRGLKMITSGAGSELYVLDPVTGLTVRDEPVLVPTQLFHRQLGTALGIRSEFYDRLRTQHAGLYDHLVNGLLEREPARRLVRAYTDGGGPEGLDGIARAYLSDRYLRIDNLDLAMLIADAIPNLPGAQLATVNVSESKMYMKILVPDGAKDLQTFWRELRDEYGPHHFFGGTDQPVIAWPGCVIENSEVGQGSLRVSSLVFIVRCSNGMVVQQQVARRHVGTVIGGGDDDGTVYKADTVKAIDEAIKLKVRDAINATVDELNFESICRQFAETSTGLTIERPVEAVKVLNQQTTLTQDECDSVLVKLIQGGDMSRFGTINAITAAAQDVRDFDRSVEMETIASGLIGWSLSEWGKVAMAA